MKTLPENLTLRAQDFPEADDNFRRLIEGINRQTEYLYSLVAGGLVIGENVEAQIFNLSGIDPSVLPIRLPKKVGKARGVFLWRVWKTNLDPVANTVGSAVTLEWTPQNGDVLITALPGLTPGTLYNLTLVVV